MKTSNVVLALSLAAIFSAIILLTFHFAPSANATTTSTAVTHVLRNGDGFAVYNNDSIGIPSYYLMFGGTSEIGGLSTPTYAFVYIMGSGYDQYSYTVYTHYDTPFHCGDRTFSVKEYDSITDTVTVEESVG